MMTDWHYETHKCAIRNSLRYAYIALKTKERPTQAGALTPYEEF